MKKLWILPILFISMALASCGGSGSEVKDAASAAQETVEEQAQAVVDSIQVAKEQLEEKAEDLENALEDL